MGMESLSAAFQPQNKDMAGHTEEMELEEARYKVGEAKFRERSEKGRSQEAVVKDIKEIKETMIVLEKEEILILKRRLRGLLKRLKEDYEENKSDSQS